MNYNISEFTSEFFDLSSNEWMKNKIKKNNGIYEYKCYYIHTNGKICTKPICKTHLIKNINKTPKNISKINLYCKQHLFYCE
jgi:hypothetical protein